MILSFSFKNFRSSKNECEIDFRKMSLKQHVESVINNEVLPVAVIYGPNGGGKSTVILALNYLANAVALPIRQFKGFGRFFPLNYKPFLLDEKSRLNPTEFCVIFTLDNVSSIEYKFYIKYFENRILEETLYEKKEKGKAALVFSRKNNDVEIGPKFSKFVLQNKNINPNIPYLSLCSIFFSDSEISKIGDWFTRISVIDFGNPTMDIVLPELFASLSQDEKYNNTMNELLKGFNLLSGFKIDEIQNSQTGNKQKIIKTFHEINGLTFDLNYNDESMGTKKILQILPSLTTVLKGGGLLVVDELDAKLHPKLLEFIISLFTNPEVNTMGSQLIFTSHDMYTLNNNVFRRDEIWFACKDKEESTILYSLGDIKGEDNRTARSDLSFSNQYLSGRYGADPYYNKLIKWSDLND